MKPNSRVVVATDFSVGAAEALREGARLAAQAKGPLGVVHVLPRLAPNAIRERLRRIDAREDSEIFIDEDPDYEQIVRRAAQWHAELIVVGSRSASPLGHMFRGVGERVVRDAHYPVLVARPGHGHGGVLAATDLTKPSLPAVVAGAEEADRRGTRLRVVHAVGFLDMEARYLLSQGSANDGGEYDFAGLEDKLEDAVGRLGIDPTCVILDGPAPPRDRQQGQGDRCRARRGRCAREERRCTCHPAWRRGGCGSERAVLGPRRARSRHRCLVRTAPLRRRSPPSHFDTPCRELPACGAVARVSVQRDRRPRSCSSHLAMSETPFPHAPWRAARSIPHPVHDPPRVLLAEDDADMRRLVAEALGADGCVVDTVPDGGRLLVEISRRPAHRPPGSGRCSSTSPSTSTTCAPR